MSSDARAALPVGARPEGLEHLEDAVVRKIAESHGGRVWVESSPGAGALFHLRLPKS